MGNASEGTVDFLKQLILEISELEQIYLEHLDAYDEVIPYVLMDELTRFVIDELRKNSTQAKQLFDRFSAYLEIAMTNSTVDITTMIRTSFCESIDSIWQETDMHKWICNRLGPNLKKSLLVSSSN